MTDRSAPVIVIGAGLAGLNCARHLHRSGQPVLVLERHEEPGGRVRTDEQNGYLLDRGFQVLLTAYPEARRSFDYEALELGSFAAGAAVFRDGQIHRLGDPRRHPGMLLSSLGAPVATLQDGWRILRMSRRLAAGSIDEILGRSSLTVREALRSRWGLSERVVERFFRPFIGGFTLDPDLRCGSRTMEFVLKMFVEGRAALPRAGMAELPRQLAGILPEGRIRLETNVAALTDEGVRTENGEEIEARATVLATGANEAHDLCGSNDRADHRSTVTLYFGAETPPLRKPQLVLDGHGDGPVNHAAVLSEVVPDYAPEGRSLVCANVLGEPDRTDGELEKSVRRQLTRWFGSEVHGWTHLRTVRVREALPVVRPRPGPETPRSVQIRDRLFGCGDYLGIPSIQTALESGRQCAERISDALTRPRPT